MLGFNHLICYDLAGLWEPSNPWLFLDKIEIGRISTTCKTSSDLVDAFTPFGSSAPLDICLESEGGCSQIDSADAATYIDAVDDISRLSGQYLHGVSDMTLEQGADKHDVPSDCVALVAAKLKDKYPAVRKAGRDTFNGATRMHVWRTAWEDKMSLFSCGNCISGTGHPSHLTIIRHWCPSLVSGRLGSDHTALSLEPYLGKYNTSEYVIEGIYCGGVLTKLPLRLVVALRYCGRCSLYEWFFGSLQSLPIAAHCIESLSHWIPAAVVSPRKGKDIACRGSLIGQSKPCTPLKKQTIELASEIHCKGCGDAEKMQAQYISVAFANGVCKDIEKNTALDLTSQQGEEIKTDRQNIARDTETWWRTYDKRTH